MQAEINIITSKIVVIVPEIYYFEKKRYYHRHIKQQFPLFLQTARTHSAQFHLF